MRPPAKVDGTQGFLLQPKKDLESPSLLFFCLPRRRPGFNPWVGKIPWRRKWQPTRYGGQSSILGGRDFCKVFCCVLPERRLSPHQGCSVKWSSLEFLLSWQQRQWRGWIEGLPQGVHKCMPWARQHAALTGQGGEKRGRTRLREERRGQHEHVWEAGETSYRVTS